MTEDDQEVAHAAAEGAYVTYGGDPLRIAKRLKAVFKARFGGLWLCSVAVTGQGALTTDAFPPNQLHMYFEYRHFTILLVQYHTVIFLFLEFITMVINFFIANFTRLY